jgi:hypothetical protein
MYRKMGKRWTYKTDEYPLVCQKEKCVFYGKSIVYTYIYKYIYIYIYIYMYIYKYIYTANFRFII